MGTNCAPFVADLLLFCYERHFMLSLSGDKEADIIAFSSTSRYLDNLLIIDNAYFDDMSQSDIPLELQLTKANSSDTKAPFLDLHLTVSDGFVSSTIDDKRDVFIFDIVNVPFLDRRIHCVTSYGMLQRKLPTPCNSLPVSFLDSCLLCLG